MNDSNTEYLLPGDLVTLNKELPNAPIMLVIRKEVSLIKASKEFLGLRCRWFTSDGKLQEATFNTKDLKKVINGTFN